MSRFSSRHLDALSLFDNDDEFNSIQHNLTSFQTRQKKLKSTEERFAWLHEQRKLKQLQLAVTKQLSSSMSNLLVEFEMGNYSKINDLFSTKAHLEKFEAIDSLQLVTDTKEAIYSIAREETEQLDAISAQLFLDTKEKLCATGAKLTEQYSSLTIEVTACRRNALKLLAEESNIDNNGVMIPKRLAAAIADARIVENKMAQLNDETGCGSIEIFEHDLKMKLRSLKHAFKDANLANNFQSSEFARRRKAVENKAMKDIANLTKQLENRQRKLLGDKHIGSKSKQMRIRLQANRVEQEIEQEKVKLQKEEEAKNNHELKLLAKSMRSKQTIWSHKSNKAKDHASITTELESEATRLLQHRSNKERTMVREAQRQSKIKSKEISDIEAAKAEAGRSQRLLALAASVPYYNDIINTVPDIHKTTKARTNDVYTGRDSSLADFQCGELKSFTNDKMFSDPKFRLANALHEAGVANSTYARNVIRQAIPRQEERTTGIKPY